MSPIEIAHSANQIRRLVASHEVDVTTGYAITSSLKQVSDVLSGIPQLLEIDAVFSGQGISSSLDIADWAGLLHEPAPVVAKTLTLMERLQTLLSFYSDTAEVDLAHEAEIMIAKTGLDSKVAQLKALRDGLSFRQVALDSADAARAAASDATTAAENANTSAGIAADADLSVHFGEYAEGQLKTARNFRVATICVIALAIIAAAVIPHLPDEETVDYIYRGAQVLALAGLSGYLGRQAGQHRRIGNWARAMQVQLKSFAAFIAPIENEKTLAAVYDEFSRRVLGAMPEKAETKNDPSSAQLMEIVTALVKKG